MMAGAILSQMKTSWRDSRSTPTRCAAISTRSAASCLSERVMFALADKIGKQTAHEVVYDASMRSVDTRHHVRADADGECRGSRQALGTEELQSLLDPTTYVGLAPADRRARAGGDACVRLAQTVGQNWF